MTPYIHKVNYYETDKMGISHHSNYVRWMEEARVDFLEQCGYGLQRLEDELGITSPVVSVECQYKRPTTFGDCIAIEVALADYTGVKLTLDYTMRDCATGALVLTGRSSHCFAFSDGRPLSMRRHAPEFDGMLKKLKSGSCVTNDTPDL